VYIIPKGDERIPIIIMQKNIAIPISVEIGHDHPSPILLSTQTDDRPDLRKGPITPIMEKRVFLMTTERDRWHFRKQFRGTPAKSLDLIPDVGILFCFFN